MEAEDVRDPVFLELAAEFPLAAIVDDHSYRRAIKILDRLFARDEQRTPGELAYFRELARIASDYEHRHPVFSWNALALDA